MLSLPLKSKGVLVLSTRGVETLGSLVSYRSYLLVVWRTLRLVTWLISLIYPRCGDIPSHAGLPGKGDERLLIQG